MSQTRLPAMARWVATVSIFFLPLAMVQQVSAAPSMTHFDVPVANSQPSDITTGPDGALWFTDEGANAIGRITASGAITEYPVPTPSSELTSITSGPDGALWFIENNGDPVNALRHIGRITTSGAIAEYPLPAATRAANEIVTGPDGALWFPVDNDSGGNAGIGRMATSGAVTIYPLSVPTNLVGFITVGPDGALWFSEVFAHKIGRITVSGSITEYPLPSSLRDPNSVVAGSDGAIWFTNFDFNNPGSSTVGRITTSGAVTEYPLPSSVQSIGEMTTGPDGNFWLPLIDAAGDHLGRITMLGSVTEYPALASSWDIGPMTAGPDGALWATSSNGAILRFDIYSTSPGLTVTSPTNMPVLSWDTIDGAVSYNIYRNSVKIGSSTSTTYTDSTAPEGTDIYYVTSVDSSGLESAPSNSVNVLVDLTPPSIDSATLSSYSILPGQSTTLTVADSDNLSGVTRTEYFVGSDPGQGNGTQMVLHRGHLSATFGSNLSAGTYTVNVRAEDAAGNWSPVATATLVVQFPAPTNLTSTTPTNNPVLSWDAVTGADHYDVYRDGVEIGSTSSTSFNDTNAAEGTHTYYLTAADASDNQSQPSGSISVLVDRTPPTITYTLSQVPNGAGWNNQAVTVTFSCGDTLSGIASCTAPVLVGQGANQAIVGTAVDAAGNTTNITVYVSVDTTKPAIAYTLSSQPDSYGWYNHAVTVTFQCSDALSGIASCSGPTTLSGNGANQTVTGTAVDMAGNTASVTTVGINIDTTPPVVTSVTLSSGLVLLLGTETITAHFADNLSGVIAADYYVNSTTATPHTMTLSGQDLTSGTATGTDSIGLLSLPLGTNTIYVRVEDAAGNWSTFVAATFTYVG